MVVILNTDTINRSMVSPINGRPTPKAADVMEMPFRLESDQTPVHKMAKPVMEQTTSVSIIGPSMATRPSRTGSLVMAAPWAIDSVPMPASLENAARFIDRIKKTCRGFRMNWMWSKPGKYRIRKQRTLEEFGHE